MNDREWAYLRFLHRVDQAATALAVLVALACAVMTAIRGATGAVAEPTVWLACTALATAAARWVPPLITIRETEETD